MKHVTIKMINQFKMTNMDWMGYTLMRGEEFDYHHIEKKCDGGPLTIANGAILVRGVSHPYIHTIELKDPEMFIYLNRILKCINAQRHMPTEKQLDLIDSVLRSFEREYSGKTFNSGKPIVKELYIKRRLKL